MLDELLDRDAIAKLLADDEFSSQVPAPVRLNPAAANTNGHAAARKPGHRRSYSDTATLVTGSIGHHLPNVQELLGLDKDVAELDDSAPGAWLSTQFRQSFNPRLPAVQEQGSSIFLESSGDDMDAELLQHFSSATKRTQVRRNRASSKRDEDLFLLDPKRAKRILANRMSAAKSKERRLLHTEELAARVAQRTAEVQQLQQQLQQQTQGNQELIRTNTELQQQLRDVQSQLQVLHGENGQLLEELRGVQRLLGHELTPIEQPCSTLQQEKHQPQLHQVHKQQQWAGMTPSGRAAAHTAPAAAEQQQQQQQPGHRRGAHSMPELGPVCQLLSLPDSSPAGLEQQLMAGSTQHQQSHEQPYLARAWHPVPVPQPAQQQQVEFGAARASSPAGAGHRSVLSAPAAPQAHSLSFEAADLQDPASWAGDDVAAAASIMHHAWHQHQQQQQPPASHSRHSSLTGLGGF